MIEAYFHSESGEELHTFGFIDWNFPEDAYHPKKLIKSDDFLFEEIQSAICGSYQVLEDMGWTYN